MKPSLHSTEKCRQSHGNRGPKRQPCARKEMKQKQPPLMFPQREWEDGSRRAGWSCLSPGRCITAFQSTQSQGCCPLTHGSHSVLRGWKNSSAFSYISWGLVRLYVRKLCCRTGDFIKQVLSDQGTQKGTELLSTKEQKPQLQRLYVGKEASPSEMVFSNPNQTREKRNSCLIPRYLIPQM